MREALIELLESWGCVGAACDPALDLAITNAVWRVKNETNLTQLPEGLENVAVSIAAGEYLKWKKNTGQLKSFDLQAAVKQIQEGDTTISFAVGEGSLTPEQRLDQLIDSLINGRMRELYRYRRLAW